MKKKPFFASFLFIVSAFLFSQCTGGDTPSASAILSKPPYKSLTDSIRDFPDKVELYLSRGLLLSQNNQHQLANPDYLKAWQLQPSEGVALEYASNLLLINKADDAILFLKDCQVKFPATLEFSRRLSEVYAGMGRRKEALAEYEKMIAQDSLDFMAWYEKGLLLQRLEDTAAAISALERSYRIQPLNYSGLALANLYSYQKNPKLLAICDDILSRDSTGEVIDAIFLKGVYYADTKQYNKAMPLLDLCIKIDWKFLDAHLEKGQIWFDQKEYNKALEAYRMAATVTNTNPDAYFWMGRCYEALKDKEQARENYERALSLDKSFYQAEDGLERLGEK